MDTTTIVHLYLKVNEMSNQDNNPFFLNNIAPHYDYVLRFLLIATSGDKELAEDMAQETMEAAWKYLKRFRNYDNIKAALITIAKNALNKHYKAEVAHEPIDEYIDIDSQDESVEEIVAGLENGEELKKSIRKLDKKYARVLMLKYYFSLSLKEIAEICMENYSTVQSWHLRALKKLKDKCMEDDIF